MGKQEAKVTRVPVGVLKFTRAITVFFQWFGDAADRLAFAEVLASNESFQAPMDETYALLGMSEADTNTLEKYFDEFYTRILKKLKEVGGSSKQRSFCACPPDALIIAAIAARVLTRVRFSRRLVSCLLLTSGGRSREL
jgi:hypothetical protein